MSDVLLYDSALSPYAQKVKIALLEKGILFERQLPDLAEPGFDFLSTSPRREVPALEHEGLFLFDSTIILQYLEDRWREIPLLPTDAAERATARSIEEVCDTRLEAAIFALNEIYALGRDFGGTKEQVEQSARTDVLQLCDWLAGQLGERDYFAGASFGYADICVYPFVRIVQQYRIALPPALDAWLTKVRMRGSVRDVEAQAREERQQFLDYAARIKAGDRPRLYRDHRIDSLIRFGALDAIVDGLSTGTIVSSSFDTQHRLANHLSGTRQGQ